MNNSAPLSVSPHGAGLSSRFATLLTTLLVTSIFAPIILRMSHRAYDYIVHTDVAVKMLANRSLSSPHFLLQGGTIAFQQLLPISFNTALTLVVLFSVAATAGLLFRCLTRSSLEAWPAGILTACLMLVAPIPLLAPLDGSYYFGYVASNVYHNPTILLLKPLAFLLFSFFFSQKIENRVQGGGAYVAATLTTIACALAKPSYIIVIVPTLALAFLIPLLRSSLRERIRFVIFAIILPALVILAIQYWLTYSVEQLPGVYQGKSHIVFAPLVVVSAASSWITAKFFLSLAFPLAVLVGYFREALVSPRLLFAWLGFVFGAIYTYFLAESGPRMYQGNFTWSGQITLFILFVVSTEFLSEQFRRNGIGNRTRRIVFIICSALFILHVLSGINLYWAQYIAGDYCP